MKVFEIRVSLEIGYTCNVTTEAEIVADGEGSFGIELPRSILDLLNAHLGDELRITIVAGGILLSPVGQSDDTETAKAFRQVMRENRDVLKRLADS